MQRHLLPVFVSDLEQLNSDDGEHELEQKSNKHYAVDRLNGDDDALNDPLKTNTDTHTRRESQNPQRQQCEEEEEEGVAAENTKTVKPF